MVYKRVRGWTSEPPRIKIVEYPPGGIHFLVTFRSRCRCLSSLLTMTRTANLRDLLENLFGCSSRAAHGAFSSETFLFLFAEAGFTPVGDRSY